MRNHQRHHPVLARVDALLRTRGRFTTQDLLADPNEDDLAVAAVVAELLSTGKLAKSYDIICPETSNVIGHVSEQEAATLQSQSSDHRGIAARSCTLGKHSPVHVELFRTCYEAGPNYAPDSSFVTGVAAQGCHVPGLRKVTF